ncbi:MAG: isoprenylcysteine carboxylmethyltransferase family protein [Rhodobacterales bacterium]|nr:isoprenylcysteine carboxylmethyltransferase family protein [Rhodobacterales bacterium]
MDGAAAHLAYGAAWASFGLGHSWLAGRGPKARLARLLGPFYRLAYNGFAVAHIGAVYLAGLWLFAGHGTWALPPALATAGLAVHLLGWVLMLWGLRGYDLGLLAGTGQVRQARAGLPPVEDEPLRLDGPHRYVRHPLYAGGVLILVGRVHDDLSAATAVFGCLYLWIGTLFEERRLLRLYGDAYARYRARVPAVLPWRGRVDLGDLSDRGAANV